LSRSGDFLTTQRSIAHLNKARSVVKEQFQNQLLCCKINQQVCVIKCQISMTINGNWHVCKHGLILITGFQFVDGTLFCQVRWAAFIGRCQNIFGQRWLDPAEKFGPLKSGYLLQCCLHETDSSPAALQKLGCGSRLA